MMSNFSAMKLLTVNMLLSNIMPVKYLISNKVEMNAAEEIDVAYLFNKENK